MKAVVTIVVVVIVLVSGVFVLAQHRRNSNSPVSSSAANSATISNYAFGPSSITVKAGATVTWINKDSVAHTVTETDGQTGPNSSDLNQGQRYSFTFKTAGTYKYDCSIHPYMTGTVIVTN